MSCPRNAFSKSGGVEQASSLSRAGKSPTRQSPLRASGPSGQAAACAEAERHGGPCPAVVLAYARPDKTGRGTQRHGDGAMPALPLSTYASRFCNATQAMAQTAARTAPMLLALLALAGCAGSRTRSPRDAPLPRKVTIRLGDTPPKPFPGLPSRTESRPILRPIIPLSRIPQIVPANVKASSLNLALTTLLHMYGQETDPSAMNRALAGEPTSPAYSAEAALAAKAGKSPRRPNAAASEALTRLGFSFTRIHSSGPPRGAKRIRSLSAILNALASGKPVLVGGGWADKSRGRSWGFIREYDPAADRLRGVALPADRTGRALVFEALHRKQLEMSPRSRSTSSKNGARPPNDKLARQAPGATVKPSLAV